MYRAPSDTFLRMSTRPHTRDFLVKGVGCCTPDPEHHVERPAGRTLYSLLLVRDGEGWLELLGKRHILTRGQAVLLPPNTPHALGAVPENPWHFYWIHFLGDGAKALLEWTPFTPENPVTTCAASNRAWQLIESLMRRLDRGYTEHALLELSRTLIDVLTVLHTQAPGENQDPQIEQIEGILDTMLKDVSAPQSLESYARRYGLSVSRFSELFRKHCGKSPMAYLTELRMQQACTLLDRTDLRIKEIAETLGYNEPFYFSRVFQKQTGMSPRKYRASHRMGI